MSILTIKITKLLDLVLLSQSYIRGDIKVSVASSTPTPKGMILVYYT